MKVIISTRVFFAAGVCGVPSIRVNAYLKGLLIVAGSRLFTGKDEAEPETLFFSLVAFFQVNFRAILGLPQHVQNSLVALYFQKRRCKFTWECRGNIGGER